MQLNASPRTDGVGDAQLQSTLPTMSWASSPDAWQAGGLPSPPDSHQAPAAQGSAPGTFSSILQPQGPCPALSCSAAHSRLAP